MFQEDAEECHQPREFVFLKKHKCASSTFQTVFSNFNRHLGKKSISPLFGSYGGGYPARMNMSFWATPIGIEFQLSTWYCSTFLWSLTVRLPLPLVWLNLLWIDTQLETLDSEMQFWHIKYAAVLLNNFSTVLGPNKEAVYFPKFQVTNEDQQLITWQSKHLTTPQSMISLSELSELFQNSHKFLTQKKEFDF